MNIDYKITDIHLDVLKEIGSIGAAHAATSLSQLLDKKIEMLVPNVNIVSFDEMFDLAGGSERIVVGILQKIDGDLSGNMFYLLPLKSANQLIKRLIGENSIDFHNSTVSELAVSAMQEVGNILAGSYLSALSDFTKLNIQPTVPSLCVDMVGAIISYGLIELSHHYDEAIIIDTQIIVEGSSSVDGHFFLLPNPEAYISLFRSLGVL
ncbi:chemotaxis protein CheC [Sporosarcina sp. FSL W8-0480]|uniref:chemotaxis protein CheC n=1 Tax=Sporosarcina sp. FSL W8-0480 TaxID=2954701 RepID=UPI0030DCE7DE